jgi:signal transduction histidine kinase/CheY-like chemotaxis protein
LTYYLHGISNREAEDGASFLSFAVMTQASGKSFLAEGGQLGHLIDEFDWSKTPLGPIEKWPTVLKTTIGLILRSPIPIVTLWGEAGIMIYNDAYSGFAGSRHPKLLGSPVREGWPEVADFNDNVMKVGLAGKTLSYQNQELTLSRSHGPEQVSMNLDYSPVVEENGKPIGVMAIVVETTQAVKAARRLLENEARLSFLDALGKETAKSTDADSILAVTTRKVGEHLGVSSCAYADMDLDQDGFTIRGDWAAPSAAHIVGRYSLADFGKLAVNNLGTGLPLIINDNLNEIAPEEAATFQSIGIGATICMPLVKEGRLIALMAIHHKMPHKWTSYELSVIREVTERSWAHIERVRSEAEVREGERRFREELEQQVKERTADLLQAQETRARAEQALLQAQKLEAIGNLTGGVAHDFNNLLMAVLGSLELLRKRIPQEDRLLRLVDNAVEGVRRGKSLTERMLAFARRQYLQPEKVSLKDLVWGMAELLQRSLGPTIILEVSIPDGLAPIEVDPNQLESAVLNLALNARDAMGGAGPLLISAKEVAPQEGSKTAFVCLTVEDKGAGMDDATLKRATEPFFTTKGVGKGTGLGLSMVQGLAEQSGGKLTLSSTPNIGTTAELCFPAAEALSAVPKAAPPQLTAVTQRRLELLLVDDDPLVLSNTTAMLEDLGHRVITASSGEAALKLINTQRFDLLLTDHAMPHMTGAQLVGEVRLRHPELSIVIATGFAELPDDISTMTRLRKPYSQHDLIDAINRCQTVPRGDYSSS